MPSSRNNSNRRSQSRTAPYSRRFNCRICRSASHPLRHCQKFLDMNMADRTEAVRRHNYCINCLAHDHSHGYCFSDRGCHHCHKFHHTLLHIDPKLRDLFLNKGDRTSSQSRPRSQSRSPARSPSPRPSTSKASQFRKPKPESTSPMVKEKASLSALIRQNRIILLPTVLVKVDGKPEKIVARCLLDSGSSVSRVSRKFVQQLDLDTLTLQEETICQLTLRSRFDANVKVDGAFRVDNRISKVTPVESLPETFKRNFPHLFLADPKFYEAAGIDIVIGVDIYPRVIAEGIYSRQGLPTAQSTIFGWTIYGLCST